MSKSKFPTPVSHYKAKFIFVVMFMLLLIKSGDLIGQAVIVPTTSSGCSGTQVTYNLDYSGQVYQSDWTVTPSSAGTVTVVNATQAKVTWTASGTVKVAFAYYSGGQPVSYPSEPSMSFTLIGNAGSLAPIAKVEYGSTITLSAGTGVTYQKCVSGCSTTSDAGWSTTTRTVTNLTQKTKFRKKLTNTSCGLFYSNTIEVDVYPQLVGGSVSIPSSLCNNVSTITISSGIGAYGGKGTIHYQWQYFNGSGFVDYAVAGSDQASLANVSLSNPTFRRFKRKAWSDFNESNVYSNEVNLDNISIGQALNAGSLTPQQICYNTFPATFSGSAPTGGGGGYTYTWQFSNDGGSTWSTPASGGASYDYQNYPNVQPLTSDLTVRRNVNASGCNESGYTTMTVDVLPFFKIEGLASDKSDVEYNTSALLSVTNIVGGNVVYQRCSSGCTDNSNWTDITGPTTSQSNVSTTSLTQSTNFRVKLVNESCGLVYSNQITVIAYPEFNPGAIQIPGLTCSGSVVTLQSAPDAYGGKTSGNMNEYSYQWEYYDENTSQWTEYALQAGGQASLVGISINDTRRRWKRRAWSDFMEVDQYTGEVNLDDIPVAAPLTPGSICYSSATKELIGTSATGGIGAYTYTWQFSSDNINWGPEYPGGESYTLTDEIETGHVRRNVQETCANVPISTSSVYVEPVPSGPEGDPYSIIQEYGRTWLHLNDNYFFKEVDATGTDISGNQLTSPIAFTSATTYYVKVQDAATLGCWSNTWLTIPITILRPPVPDNKTYDFCLNEDMTLSADEIGALTYDWYESDGSTLLAGAQTSYDPSGLAVGIHTFKVASKAFETASDGQATYTVNVSKYCDDKLNTVLTRSFSIDELGNPVEVSASKTYFDLDGQLLQTQSKEYQEAAVLVTEPIYDVYDREVGGSLVAATYEPDHMTKQTEFGYNLKFITTGSAGNEERYNSSHFDGSTSAKLSPAPVADATPGTLGWYYSANNTLEDNVPQTNFPYTRTDFYEDGSGEVKRSAAPGDELRMGKNHESITKTLTVGNQAVELKHYNAVRQLVLGLSATPTLDKVYKQIAIDPDHKEVVSYQTEEGTIATAIVDGSGSGIQYDAIEGNVEIHVPSNVANTTVTLAGRTAEFKILDKVADENDVTGSVASGSSISLNPGIYSLSGLTSATYSPNYTEYSYNIYDNAGRLAASIAPLGVEKILSSGVPVTRSELTYTTFYSYDFEGRLVEMDEPDAGVTKYLYRKDGSIRFSENELQRSNNRYSYTNYDFSGRPVESGEYLGADTYASRNDAVILETRGRSGYTDDTERVDWVETYYDLVYTNGSDLLADELETYLDAWYTERYTAAHGYNTAALAAHYAQDFLEGAVSYTRNKDVTTWYSYDEFGQVEFIVMKYENMDGGQYFTIDYVYDYLGNVTEVAFQKHFAGESFYHHYEYNKNQQLTKVYTSQAGEADPNKYLHATYHYYLHGPLKRVELAENLQGTDYTYTAQGWLKAINHPATNMDPGGDGNNTFFSDAFGMEIDYYNGDHTSSLFQSANPHMETDEQFAGNIRAITWGRGGTANDQEFEKLEATLDAPLTESTELYARDRVTITAGFDSNGYPFTMGIDPTALKDIPLEIEAQQYEYDYDFKNQLTEAVYTDAVTAAATDDRYAVKRLKYDANGNIDSLRRYDENGAIADDFGYKYAYELDSSDPNYGLNNQLQEVSGYSTYEYNSIGQMTASIGRADYGSQYFDYDVTGKVTAIYSDAAKTTAVAKYKYDDRGFRVMKEDDNGNQIWYVRDASGNIITIYDLPSGASQAEFVEAPIYGSGKIGTSFRDPQKYKYSYELTDHLGNVRAVVSKLKFYEVATMETANQITESAIFENWSAHRQQDVLLNTTNVTGNESYSVRLDGTNGVVGPAMSKAVKKGDKVSFSVNAMYVDGFSSTGLASNMFGLVASAFGVTAGGETQAIYDGLNSAVTAAAGFLATPPSGVPKAYIQCLMFDKDFNNITTSEAHAMVSASATGNAGSAESISGEIEMPEDGYIYVYIANETEGALVNFDDFTVSILGFDVSEMTDYYPFGSIAKHWEKEPYRFGYQGQFAEKNEATGALDFQWRSLDSKIGRWTSIDQKRQHRSPYLAMANNPILFVDADGLADWPAFGWALLATTGGALEVAAGVAIIGATEGIATPMGVPMVVDGSARTMLGFHNMMAAIMADDAEQYSKLSAPSNLGGVVGAGVDYATGNEDKYWQTAGEITNDVASIATAIVTPNVNQINQVTKLTESALLTVDMGKLGMDYYEFVPKEKEVPFDPSKYCSDCIILDNVTVTDKN